MAERCFLDLTTCQLLMTSRDSSGEGYWSWVAMACRVGNERQPAIMWARLLRITFTVKKPRDNWRVVSSGKMAAPSFNAEYSRTGLWVKVYPERRKGKYRQVKTSFKVGRNEKQNCWLSVEDNSPMIIKDKKQLFFCIERFKKSYLWGDPVSNTACVIKMLSLCAWYRRECMQVSMLGKSWETSHSGEREECVLLFDYEVFLTGSCIEGLVSRGWHCLSKC